MQLNIRLISHPLVEHLSNIANNSSIPKNIKNQATKNLGLFMIYETIREWIRIYKLKIKLITSTKEISIIDPKESFLIIFNDLNSLSMVQDIQLLLPQVSLQFIPKNEIHHIKNYKKLDKPKNTNLYKKIIILNQKLDIKYIKSLINALFSKHRLQMQQIHLTCIICKNNELIKLSKSEEYKHLKIYTTKIIEN